MSDVQPPKDQAPPPPQPDPIGDIDKLLENEDPGFLKFLEEVRAIEADKSVVIDTVSVEEGDAAPDSFEPEATTKAGKWKAKAKAKVRVFLINTRVRMQQAVVSAAMHALVWLKTKPKEFLQYTGHLIKQLAAMVKIPIAMFRAATRPQQIVASVVTVILLASLWVLIANFEGIWLPTMNEPIVHSLVPLADKVVTFDTKDAGESFYSAFPQDLYEFLFPKLKVNLRATTEHPNPMGAFEVIVELDSNDSAIEIRDREVEFYDRLQRTIEQETFTDLESELGKSRLKARIQKDINANLTQGWVKDVRYKTFVLKP